jgi:hypothetical protein
LLLDQIQMFSARKNSPVALGHAPYGLLQRQPTQQARMTMKCFDHLSGSCREPVLFDVFEDGAVGLADRGCGVDHRAKLYDRALHLKDFVQEEDGLTSTGYGKDKRLRVCYMKRV